MIEVNQREKNRVCDRIIAIVKWIETTCPDPQLKNSDQRDGRRYDA
jgi:hypothetical protein